MSYKLEKLADVIPYGSDKKVGIILTKNPTGFLNLSKKIKVLVNF
jgi:hypothetical protein